MYDLMKRLSSATRQLAERHARLKGRAEQLSSQLTRLTGELAKVREQLAAVGTLLVSFDARVEPLAIAPITAWKGKYGTRGALRDAVLELLRAAQGGWLPTPQLSLLLRDSFDLSFSTREELRNWEVRSVWSQLRRFVDEGLVEKSKTGAQHNDPACWRLKPDPKAFSLDDLRAIAAGVELDTVGA